MNSDQETLEFAVDLARQAGEVLMKYFGTELTRRVKTHQDDFVTEADLAVEKLILTAIRATFPDDAILAEESGQHSGSSGYTWIVDPLDGTKNFAEGKNVWGVMLARARGDDVLLSVVLNPSQQTLARAELGQGVFLNERRVMIPPRLTYQDIKSSLPNSPGLSVIERARALREGLRERGIELSRGSAAGVGLEALSLLYDFRISIPPGKIWDHAPISLFLKEAGLLVTNFNGEPYVWHRDIEGYIAAAPALHAKILPLLRG